MRSQLPLSWIKEATHQPAIVKRVNESMAAQAAGFFTSSLHRNS